MTTLTLANVVHTLRDLGVPTLVGASLGGAISHYSAKARGREEQAHTRELLVLQDERRAAQTTLTAARDIRNRLNVGAASPSGDLHNEWSDRINAPTRQIRSDELDRRVSAMGWTIMLGMLVNPDADEFVSYPLLRATLDVEEWLQAWLRDEEPPAAHLPPVDKIRKLTHQPATGGITFEPLNEWLQERY